MNYLWDYDENELKKTESGRIKILERQINYGTQNTQKISRSLVRKYWNRLNLFPLQKRLFELILDIK